MVYGIVLEDYFIAISLTSLQDSCMEDKNLEAKHIRLHVTT